MKYWFKFYFYSLSLGIRYLFQNPLSFSKEAIKRIIIPMDIARYFEIPATYWELNPQAKDKILDISSPKLLSCFIAEMNKSEIAALDIWKEEISNWRGLTNRIGGIKGLKLIVGDGRALPFKNGTFDKIFSVSVIEHISEEGDIKCIKELSRVLKPGGIIVLTTPIGNDYKENWVMRDVYGKKYSGQRPLFLSKIYTREMLKERIISPSGCKLERFAVCQEKPDYFSRIYSSLFPLLVPFGLIFPLFAVLSLKPGIKIGRKNNVLIRLRKPPQ